MRCAARPRVVVVDDDYDFQAVLRRWLAPRYDAVSVYDGEQLFSDLADLDPALIIMVVNLPGPDGFRLCERLRGHPRLRERPLLFLTACSDDGASLKRLRAAGGAFMSKPVERAPLLRAVAGLVAGGEGAWRGS